MANHTMFVESEMKLAAGFATRECEYYYKTRNFENEIILFFFNVKGRMK